jgi:hypothetical protein
MDNWFRGPRRISDLIHALGNQGTELPQYRRYSQDIDFAPMADAFSEWYSERHGRPLGAEVAEALAEDWLEQVLPGTENAVSPGRAAYMRDLFTNDYDDPVIDEALVVFPDWVRWLGEESGLPADLLDVAVAAAHPDPEGRHE